jgi:putative transcriptional regulator
MSKLGKRLIAAVDEARAIARGEVDKKAWRIHAPADIDVKAIRRELRLSQAEFAGRYAIELATLKDWEQGRRRPEGPARTLLITIKREPAAVKRALDRELAAV